MVMRREHETAFALGYVVLGMLLILTKDAGWQVILAFGLFTVALLEYMGGEDGERNWLFIVLFGILGVLILIETGYDYWILVFTFMVWGGYEIIEEKVLNKKWDAVGVGALLVGVLLLLTGLMGNTYEPYLAMAFGIMCGIQGLKEWFD